MVKDKRRENQAQSLKLLRDTIEFHQIQLNRIVDKIENDKSYKTAREAYKALDNVYSLLDVAVGWEITEPEKNTKGE